MGTIYGIQVWNWMDEVVEHKSNCCPEILADNGRLSGAGQMEISFHPT